MLTSATVLCISEATKEFAETCVDKPDRGRGSGISCCFLRPLLIGRVQYFWPSRPKPLCSSLLSFKRGMQGVPRERRRSHVTYMIECAKIL